MTLKRKLINVTTSKRAKTMNIYIYFQENLFLHAIVTVFTIFYIFLFVILWII